MNNNNSNNSNNQFQYFCETKSNWITDKDDDNPCLNSPCGQNAQCNFTENAITCKCLRDFIGYPPNCRLAPKCESNSECASHLTCIDQRCKDLCASGFCGKNTECRVVGHNPMCKCLNGFDGDPFVRCSMKMTTEDAPTDPCNPNPCGVNTICREQSGIVSCLCLAGFFGDPYERCSKECALDKDCSSHQACIRNRCQDPCPGACGRNAECQIMNHSPTCVCKANFSGDPYFGCKKIEELCKT